MTAAGSERQEVTGQWNQQPVPPADFIALVSQVTAIGVGVQHLAEDQRDQRRVFDSFLVEHRSQHLEDRALGREERNEMRQSITDSVSTQLDEVKSGRKIYVGLIVTGVGAVIADIVIRLVQK